MNEFQAEHALHAMPGVLAFASYVFGAGNLVAGPYVEYSEYEDFITRRGVSGRECAASAAGHAWAAFWGAQRSAHKMRKQKSSITFFWQALTLCHHLAPRPPPCTQVFDPKAKKPMPSGVVPGLVAVAKSFLYMGAFMYMTPLFNVGVFTTAWYKALPFWQR